jgi:hydroxypyruvate isomerase
MAFALSEFLFPYEFDVVKSDPGSTPTGSRRLCSTPRRNWEKGERGLASLPGREEEFKRAFDARWNTRLCSETSGCT